VDFHAARQVLVVPGTEFDARHRRRTPPLFVENDQAAIAELIDAIAAEPADAIRVDLMTWPTLTFVFLGEQRDVELGRVSYLHPGWLRDAGDRRIARPERIEEWLVVRGWPGAGERQG